MHTHSEEAYHTSIAVRELRHGCVMERIAPIQILLVNDLTIAFNDHIGILLKKTVRSHIEVTVCTHSFRSMIDCANQVALLDI